MKFSERYSASFVGCKQFLCPCEIEFPKAVDKTLPEINKTPLVFYWPQVVTQEYACMC